MMAIPIPSTTVSTKKVEGIRGSFFLSDPDSTDNSIPIEYVETHIGFSEWHSNQDLLSEISIFREAFDIHRQSFKHMMQRNISDDRVSIHLIPYLLETENLASRAVFFPPIVGLLIPVEEGSGSIRSQYSELVGGDVQRDPHPKPEWAAAGWEQDVASCGVYGQADFDFRIITNVKAAEPQYTAEGEIEFKRNRCKIVIIDGQHRAMAVLALYRNALSKDVWPIGKEFQHYYQYWKDQMGKYSEDQRKSMLSNLHLPMILCAAPTISEGMGGEIEELAKSLFVDLNQNAKKVDTETLQILDTDDLVSLALLEALDAVKLPLTASTSSTVTTPTPPTWSEFRSMHKGIPQSEVSEYWKQFKDGNYELPAPAGADDAQEEEVE